ncbi:MAG: hypothetical protein IT384_09880 [Deltaproteobacteria bacterium]|nr:hypothetical protein [Deltaproteobacteria bacterium]
MKTQLIRTHQLRAALCWSLILSGTLAGTACGGSESEEASTTSYILTSQQVHFDLATAGRIAAIATGGDSTPVVTSAIKVPGKEKLTLVGAATAQCLCDGTTASDGCQWDVSVSDRSAECVGSCSKNNEPRSCKVKLDLLGGGTGTPGQVQPAGG